MSTIRLEGVSKEFRLPDGQLLRVLDNVSFEVVHQTFSTILGPSGCGKSTILNLIAGVDRHTSGQITIHGKSAGREYGSGKAWICLSAAAPCSTGAR